MELWNDILRMALLGSERVHLTPEVSRRLSHYGIDTEDELSQLILQGAATLSPLRKAAVTLHSSPISPPPAVEELEQRPRIPDSSIRHLQHILSGRYAYALPEYIRHLLAGGKQLPPEFIPRFLDYSLQHPERWPVLGPVLGERAQWLINLRPHWHVLSSQAQPERWPYADMEERMQIIRLLRQQQPNQALSLLSGLWPELDYRKKQEFLSLLEHGLSSEDEQFLENALNDGRKEVRRSAALLLCKIPGSQLGDRLYQYVRNYIEPTARHRLVISWPEDPPPKELREAIQPKQWIKSVGSLKRAYLFAALRQLSPQHWQELTASSDQAELVRSLADSQQAELLLGALSDAAVLWKDADLADSILRFWMGAERIVPADAPWEQLARLWPQAELLSVAEEVMKQQPDLLPEHHPLTRILYLGTHHWDVPLAQYVVLGHQQWMQESRTISWERWHYKQLLKTAAYRAPISCLQDFNSGWPTDSPVYQLWVSDIDRLLDIMNFRRRMIAELSVEKTEEP